MTKATKIKIPRETMLDYLNGETVGAIETTTLELGRWSVQRRMVFKHTDGLTYIAFYSEGATEYQEESPWEDEDEVECYLAEQMPILAWQVVGEA